MDEMIDLTDEFGNPIGRSEKRSVIHARGLLHRTAHIWIVRGSRENLEVLLQKRAMNKDSYPGCYDTSSAGHILAGDEPEGSAKRELKEELGIEAEKLQYAGNIRLHYTETFHGKRFDDNEVVFVYWTEGSGIDLQKLTLQEEEVESVCWMPLAKLKEETEKGNPQYCVTIESIRLLCDTMRACNRL